MQLKASKVQMPYPLCRSASMFVSHRVGRTPHHLPRCQIPLSILPFSLLPFTTPAPSASPSASPSTSPFSPALSSYFKSCKPTISPSRHPRNPLPTASPLPVSLFQPNKSTTKLINHPLIQSPSLFNPTLSGLDVREDPGAGLEFALAFGAACFGGGVLVG